MCRPTALISASILSRPQGLILSEISKGGDWHLHLGPERDRRALRQPCHKGARPACLSSGWKGALATAATGQRAGSTGMGAPLRGAPETG